MKSKFLLFVVGVCFGICIILLVLFMAKSTQHIQISNSYNAPTSFVDSIEEVYYSNSDVYQQELLKGWKGNYTQKEADSILMRIRVSNCVGDSIGALWETLTDSEKIEVLLNGYLYKQIERERNSK